MQRDVVLHVLQIDGEVGDLAIGIAGDVHQRRVDRGLFLQAVQGSDREKLLQRPAIEQRLEDREIADVLVGEEFFQLVKFFGLITGLRPFLVDLFAGSARKSVRRRRDFRGRGNRG